MKPLSSLRTFSPNFDRQDGELLVDRPELRLLGLVEVGSAADELFVGLLQKHGLLGSEAERRPSRPRRP